MNIEMQQTRIKKERKYSLLEGHGTLVNRLFSLATALLTHQNYKKDGRNQQEIEDVLTEAL